MNKQKNGFSLIELIIVIVLISILFGTGIPLLANLSRSFQFSIGRKNLSESAGVALRRMDREIRRLENAKNVVTATGSTYQFIDIGNDNIQYSLSGTTLNRTVNGTTSPLAENVTSLNFTYYDYSGNQILTAPVVSPDPTDIYTIEINITLSSGGNTIYYMTRIKPILNRRLS